MKFKVGDRVLAIDNTGLFKDWTEGIVSEVPPAAPNNYRVRFPGGVNLYVKDCESIKPLPIGGNHKIVITADGKTTLARLYEGDKVVKSKEAKCRPTDTFSFQTGAELAFKRLFEKPVTEKPEPPKAELAPEPKTEPVKLYCVESFEPGEWLTKGKIYESTPDFRVTYDDGFIPVSGYPSIAAFKDANRRTGGPLYPLVKRPAKVGEWVYCTENYGGFTKAGTIYSVVSVPRGGAVSFHDPSGYYHCTNELPLNGYLTLDGYQPEEKKPEPVFYNGKVVCVAKGYKKSVPVGRFVIGKIYTVKDGAITGEDMYTSDQYVSVERLSEGTGWTFVEYKGEA